LRLLHKNIQALDYLSGNNSLLDSRISGFSIGAESDDVFVDITITMRNSSEYKQLMLKFKKCLEYQFSYSNDYFFYNVESLKLLQKKDGTFYVSFDPSDSEEAPSEEDLDIVNAETMEVYQLS
jgi:hypothetical protein